MTLKALLPALHTMEEFNALSFEERCAHSAYQMQKNKLPFFVKDGVVSRAADKDDVTIFRKLGYTEISAREAFQAVFETKKYTAAGAAVGEIIQLLENDRA